VYSGLEIKIV